MSESKAPEEGKSPVLPEEPMPDAPSRRQTLDRSKPPREWRQAPRPTPTARRTPEAAVPVPGPLDLGKLEPERPASSRLEDVAAPPPESRPAPTTLPTTYGADRLALLVRDPHWSYAWWELTEERLAGARQSLGEKGTLVLRFYDISLIEWDGANHHEFFDIEVQDVAGNWYVELGKPGASFVAEIGLRGMQGRFVALVRSNPVCLPRDSMSSQVDENWLILEEQYQRMFELSGGSQIGLGSAEILRALEERLRRELAAAGVSSFGISSLASRRET
jgi:hypothetical protein